MVTTKASTTLRARSQPDSTGDHRIQPIQTIQADHARRRLAHGAERFHLLPPHLALQRFVESNGMQLVHNWNSHSNRSNQRACLFASMPKRNFRFAAAKAQQNSPRFAMHQTLFLEVSAVAIHQSKSAKDR